MEVLARITTIRKQKYIVFCDIISSLKDITQISYSRDQHNDGQYHVGDIVFVKGFVDKNNYGEDIFMCSDIVKLVNPVKSISGKSCQNTKLLASGYKKKALYNSLNGGDCQKIWSFKIFFIDLLNKYLQDQGFTIVRTKHLTNCRGTYNANPFSTISKHDKKTQYLRITMELELKKIVMVTLQAVAEIGTVFRNMGKNSIHSTEFQVLELVKPLASNGDIIALMKGICRCAVSAAQSRNIAYNTLFDSLEEKSIYELVKEKDLYYSSQEDLYNLYKTQIRPEIDNLIVTDIPSKDPFVKREGEWGVEVEWVIHGSRIAHGFEDETDSEILLERFINQAKTIELNGATAEVDYEFIDMMRYGYPPSASLGMGFDRFFCFLLQLDHIEVAINALGF